MVTENEDAHVVTEDAHMVIEKKDAHMVTEKEDAYVVTEDAHMMIEKEDAHVFYGIFTCCLAATDTDVVCL